MKITYIYHEYRNRRKRYADEMTKLGHDVSLIFVKDKKAPNQINILNILDTKPDMVFLLSPFYIANNVITKEAIIYLKAKKIPIVCYSTLNTQIPFTEMDETWKKFDIFFAQHRDMTDHLKSIGVDAHYVPLGFYPDQYPYSLQPQKNIDISFMGNPQTTVPVKQDQRLNYCRMLQEFGIKVYGSGFNGRGLKSKSYKTHKHQVKVYSKSKINIDLPFINSAHPFYRGMYHLKNRFFEIPATGNFLMTVRCDEFTDILGEDMVGYFDANFTDLRGKVAHYLNNPRLRAMMASKAHKEVINKHTYSHRFQEMFKIMGM